MNQRVSRDIWHSIWNRVQLECSLGVGMRCRNGIFLFNDRQMRKCQEIIAMENQMVMRSTAIYEPFAPFPDRSLHASLRATFRKQFVQLFNQHSANFRSDSFRSKQRDNSSKQDLLKVWCPRVKHEKFINILQKSNWILFSPSSVISGHFLGSTRPLCWGGSWWKGNISF